MSDLIPLLVIGVIALCLLGFVANLSGGKPKSDISRFVRADPLMSPMEEKTIDYIERALPWARVHAQVSMGAILKTVKGLDRAKTMSVRNQFSSKRIDYVVQHRATSRVVLLIELDDRTHNRAADATRDKITSAAGYVTLRLPATEKPTADNVRGRIEATFQQNPQLALPINLALEPRA